MRLEVTDSVRFTEVIDIGSATSLSVAAECYGISLQV